MSNCKNKNQLDLFNQLEQKERGNSYKYVSKATTNNGAPIIEIYEKSNINKKRLVLSFVRSSKGCTLPKIMEKFLCYAYEQGFDEVQLEDDALFTNKNKPSCLYNALIYRALLENKGSIYENYGFKPRADTQKLREIIYSYKMNVFLREIESIINIINPNKEINNNKFISLLLHAKGTCINNNNNKRLGECIRGLECKDMREVINTLIYLAAKLENYNKKMNTRVIYNDFLESLRQYYTSYRLLTREPSCNLVK